MMAFRKLIPVLIGFLWFLLLDFGTMYVYKRYQEYRKSLPENSFRTSTVYHHGLVPNFNGEGDWGSVQYSMKTNSLGFRDRTVRDIPLRSDEYRLLLIGDSFTEGLGLEYEQTFAGILEDRLQPRNIAVLNGGVLGYSPKVFYEKIKYLIESVGLEFHHVVCFIDISDIQDEVAYHTTMERTFDYLERKERVDPDALKEPLPIRIKQWLKDNSVTYKVLSLIKFYIHPRTPINLNRSMWTFDEETFNKYAPLGIDLALKHMDQLYALLHRHGILLTVVVYPWPDQIYHQDLDSKQVEVWKTWAKKHGARFINLFPEFIRRGESPEATYKRYFIHGDVHWNSRGHEWVAASLLNQLFIPQRHQ